MYLRRRQLTPNLAVMSNTKDQKLFAEHVAQDRDGQTLELTLFKSDTCFFCHRVMSVVQSLQIPITLKDTRHDSKARDELIAVGGKRQVPCLFINGTPLYESSDIIKFFQNSVTVQPRL